MCTVHVAVGDHVEGLVVGPSHAATHVYHAHTGVVAGRAGARTHLARAETGTLYQLANCDENTF